MIKFLEKIKKTNYIKRRYSTYGIYRYFEGYDILFSKGKIVRIEKNIMASQKQMYDDFGKHIIQVTSRQLLESD